MAIYSKLNSVRKLTNASLTSIIDVTNLNFQDLSSSFLEFLNNLEYNENTNSVSLRNGDFENLSISDTLYLELDGIPTFTIDSLGKAQGQELLVKVSESKRRRFTDFPDWPDIGVPGEIIYTGVQNQRPEFGEDFIGYLDSRGWVSLTTPSGPFNNLVLSVQIGSPIVIPTASQNTGIIWAGPIGYETAYNPPTNTIYYTDEFGNNFDIITDFVWERIGDDAKFRPNGIAIIGDPVNNGSLRYVDGNQQAGYVLTSDSSGNASWQPPSGGGGGGGSSTNSSYVTIVDFTAGVPEVITHNLGTSSVHVQLIDLDTNELISADVDNYTANALNVTSSVDNLNVKVVVLSAGGTSLTTQTLTPDDKFMTALTTVLDGDLASNDPITNTPVDGCYVAVHVNGIEYEVGNGVTTKACYFATPGSPNLPKGFLSTHPNGQVEAGDFLYWNGSIAGFQLVAGDRISLHYMAPVQAGYVVSGYITGGYFVSS